MKNIKWRLKSGGVFLVILFFVVIAGNFVTIRWNKGKKENSEAVWELPTELSSNNIMETNIGESETELESSLWFLPQAEDCLITESEKEELNNMALTAAGQIKEVYKEIEITDSLSYGSNIKDFTRNQRREAAALLGNAGYVSVTDDVNMKNYEKVENFYSAYIEQKEAMVTIFNVNLDGLLSVITFIYRNNRLQTYYVEIGWQKGGIQELRNTLVSDIAEIKLTEKGYFIYAYKRVIPHSSLRQYWRIKPLSDKCRELTAKYIYGLSYVNYNLLVTN